MIIYFSGEGNTRSVAAMLAARLGGEWLHELSPAELLAPDTHPLSLPEGDTRLIWAFPTYSWGIPPVVARYMKRFRPGRGVADATHVMLTTCGDDMAYTDRQWRRIMAKRSFGTAGAYAVIMPNTYTLMKGFDTDPKALADKKIAEAPAAVEAIAASIEQGGADILVRGRFPWIKSAVIYPWFCRYAMSPKPFHSTEGCISCGKCARFCPTANITMADGRPQWGEQCALCLRCYHICPRHAVAYGKATEGKGQYMCR